MTDELSQNNSTQRRKDAEVFVITPRDEDYQQTKRLKKTGAALKSPFKELADWVAATYGVHVLNVVYDTVKPDDRPRLSVVLEAQEVEAWPTNAAEPEPGELVMQRWFRLFYLKMQTQSIC